MKTKHIFGTILMAAFAAACSNEDLQLVENPAQVGERIELGNVTLSIGETESRFAVGDNFNDVVAEIGDKVGAALIDVYAPGTETKHTKDAKYNYTMTDYISTNYAFEYNGSVWTTPAKMVEGNYMFYAPYNASHATRKPIVAKLDAVQQLVATTNGIDELSAIKQMIASGNVMNVSHEFLAAADDANVETALLPIYAYPYITLTNDYAEPIGYPEVETPMDLVIDQIVIKNKVSESEYGQFTIEAPFAVEKGSTAIETTAGFVSGLRDFTYWLNSNKPSETKKGEFAKKLGKGAYTSNILGNATGNSSAIVVKAPKGFTLEKKGGTVSFYAVIPAEEYGALEIDIYTDKGVFTKVIENATISAGKRYPVEEYNNDGTALLAPTEGGEVGAGAKFTMNFADMEESEEATLVASTEDLLTFVQNAPSKNEDGDANVVNVNALTSDIQVNAAVMSAIKAKSKSGWTINFGTPVTIATSLDSSNKKINFDGGAIVDGATVTLGGCATIEGSLTVKSGAVTVNGAEISGTVVNKGTLAVNSDVEGNITNNGAITIANPVKAKITNNGDYATLTVGDGEKLNNSAKNFNELTITNTKGYIEVKANTVAGISENAAKQSVTNYGSLEVTDNKGTIKNYSVISKIENNGHISMETSTASVTLGEDGTGSVDNTVDATVKGMTETQEVYYEFTSDVDGALIPEASTYNTIRLTGMTWKAKESQEITEKIVMTDATISLYVANEVLTLNCVHVKKTDDNLSAMKGNTAAEIVITEISGDQGAKLKVTGVTVEGVNIDEEGVETF